MPPVVKVLEQSLDIDFDPKGLEIHHSADWLLLGRNAELTVLQLKGVLKNLASLRLTKLSSSQASTFLGLVARLNSSWSLDLEL